MSWDILPKSNLQYFLQKLKEKFDLKADKEEVEESDTSNTTPFLYRQTPHNADGVFLDELVGGSVAWNQLVQNGDFADSSNWSVYDTSKATLTINNNIAKVVYKTSASAELYIFGLGQQNIAVNRMHKILICFDVLLSYDGSFGLDAFGGYKGISCNANVWSHFAIIFNDNISQQSSNILLRPLTAVTQDNYYQVKNVNIIDLTQMFGTTIADYVYTLEQSTAGSGIAWLKSHGFFTKDYYPYNTGELISVKTSGKKYVGKNLVEEILDGCNINSNGVITSGQSEFSMCIANVIKGMTYVITTDDLNGFVGDFFYEKPVVDSVSYDSTRIVVNNRIFTAPISGYVAFRTRNGYATPQCEIGSSATDYEPYTEHTYDISNIDLRGIPKLVNNELVYDGDVRKSDGSTERKYNRVDLSTITSWSSGAVNSTTNMIRFYKAISDKAYGQVMMCNRFVTKGSVGYDGDTYESISGSDGNGRIYIVISASKLTGDLSTEANRSTAFINWITNNPTSVDYVKATPTTETTDPYTNPQICDKDGTEEFIDDRTVPVPVGHNSRYADLPAIMDGDYLSYMARNFASKEYVDRALEEVDTELDNKVDKVSGKDLSTNDYTNEEKALVATIPDKADADDIAGTKTVSGNPITLTDASETYAESLVVELEPKQDLHGQSAPYVGGAGKNKLPMTISEIKAANTSGTWSGNVFTHNNGVTFTILTDDGDNVTGIKINGTATGNIYFRVSRYNSVAGTFILNGCPSGGGNSGTYNVYDDDGNGFTDVGSGSQAVTLASGTRVSIYIQIFSGYTASNIIFYPMIRLATETDPTFAPYSNICPISGYEGVEVDDVGKNLFDVSKASQGKAITWNNASLFTESGSWTSDYLEVEQNTNYIANKTIDQLLAFDENKNNIYTYKDGDWVSGGTSGNACTSYFSVPSGVKYIRLSRRHNTSSETDSTSFQLEKGTTATPYAPYQSATASVTFGQTVYGGSVDLTTGVLTVDRASVDLGTLTWASEGTDASGLYRYYTNDIASNIKQAKNYLCSSYSTAESNQNNHTNGRSEVLIHPTSKGVIIWDTYATATDMKNALNGVQLVYELAEPTVIQLTPQELKLLQDTNNITTNGTTINLGYQPDNVIGDTLKVAEDYTDRVMESIGSDVVANISGTITYSGETISLKAVKFKNGVKFLYISCFGFPKVSSVIGINGFLTSEFYPSNPINVDVDLVAFDNSNNPFRVTIGKTNGTIYVYGAPDDGIELRGIYM